jgi:hypothetical protein
MLPEVAMMSLARIPVPDSPVPGRYVVVGYVGRASEELHRWSRREWATRNADDVITGGWSSRYESRFTKVQVRDRLNGTLIYERTARKVNYGE